METEPEADETYNLIIRTIDHNNLPDVENYVKGLHAKGFFKKLIDEENLTVEEIKNFQFPECVRYSFEKARKH